MQSIFLLIRKLTIPLYRIEGLGFGRLCELIRRASSTFSGEKSILIHDFRGERFFHCFLKEHMGGQIFFRGHYSGDQLDLLGTLLKSDSVFIDIGANQGEFTIAASAHIKRGLIFSIEPVPKYHQRLLNNIKINKIDNVIAYQFAISDTAGFLPIYDSPDIYSDGTKHDGLPSLYVSNSRRNVIETVEIKRLDDVLSGQIIPRLDVIKLDIEGAEWAALRGAVNTLARYRPVLILEIGRETCLSAGYTPIEFAQWIIEQGYYIEKITSKGKTEAILPMQLGEFQNIVAYPLICAI